MLKVVIDTNVFISGIFWKGNYCSQIINVWSDKKFFLVTSMETLEEFIGILKKFRIKLADENIMAWKNRVLINSIIVKPLFQLNIYSDLTDNKFIEAACEGQAEYIVTQDKDLLNIEEYQGIKIIKPEEFLKIIHDQSKSS